MTLSLRSIIFSRIPIFFFCFCLQLGKKSYLCICNQNNSEDVILRNVNYKQLSLTLLFSY